MRTEYLTVENCPPCLAAFRAASVDEAFLRMQDALLVDGKEGAVWLMDGTPSDQCFNPALRAAHSQFLQKHPGRNFFMKEMDFSPNGYLADMMSPNELEIGRYLNRAAELIVTKMLQVEDPDSTVRPHFDMWAGSEEKVWQDAPAGSDRMFGGRRMRLLLTQNGDGPIFFEKPDTMDIVPAERGKDGILVNTHDLTRGWQVPGHSLTAITLVAEWAKQASLHASPTVSAAPDAPRVQTRYEFKF